MNTDPALKPYIARVREIADRHDNGDSYAIELAAANLAARRPAYWSGSLGYSNSTAGILIEAVNRKASVLDACAELKVCYPYRTWIETPNLDYLLPLNEAALHDLQSAYQACGTFRGMTELARRTERAEGLSPALDAGGRVAVTTRPGPICRTTAREVRRGELDCVGVTIVVAISDFLNAGNVGLEGRIGVHRVIPSNAVVASLGGLLAALKFRCNRKVSTTNFS